MTESFSLAVKYSTVSVFSTVTHVTDQCSQDKAIKGYSSFKGSLRSKNFVRVCLESQWKRSDKGKKGEGRVEKETLARKAHGPEKYIPLRMQLLIGAV